MRAGGARGPQLGPPSRWRLHVSPWGGHHATMTPSLECAEETIGETSFPSHMSVCRNPQRASLQSTVFKNQRN